ncbi:MAG: cbb3-type cytochrome c oxidase N-terminal domain-containing protein [Chitinophagaceae bacterium]
MHRNTFLRNPGSHIALLLPLFLITCLSASAKGGGVAPQQSVFENSLALTLLIIIFILLLAIGLLASVVRGGMDIYRDKRNKQQTHLNKTGGLIAVFLLMLSSPVFAEETAMPVVSAGSLSPTIFFCLVSVIAVELLVIFGLLYSLKSLLGIEAKKKPATVKSIAITPPVKFWERFNRLKPLEQEYEIELDHSYDGIKELDNRLPPWWLYGFYISILFAAVYLWRANISHAAPSPLEEYAAQVREADIEKTAYLANAANNIDETTVVLITDKGELESGKNVYEANCSPCHGKLAEGVVGPNLTDNYWLHGGNLQEIFKTIKYGVAEKGMRSWKDEFSPKQLAQLTSYIIKLQGTNPPNAKEKQGELYVENKELPGKESSILKKTSQAQ